MGSFKFLDTTDNLLGLAPKIKAASYHGAFKYSASSKLYPHKNWSLEEIEEFHANGLVCAVVFETSNQQAHFSGATGEQDALAIALEMQRLGFPMGLAKGGFMAYDLDVAITQQVLDYAAAAHAVLKDHGYLAGAYGSGELLLKLKAAGEIHYTWESQSTGFPGYSEEEPYADIVQKLTTPLGLSGDDDICSNLLWAW
jgi:hypothetical protein